MKFANIYVLQYSRHLKQGQLKSRNEANTVMILWKITNKYSSIHIQMV